MEKTLIPDIVVGRLPVYLLALQHLEQRGLKFTSSQELGEIVSISAAQIRKDLSFFGEFGKQGTGYPIESLAEGIRQILHVDRVWEIAVVGAGDIGNAIARYQGFADRGFKVGLIFDIDPAKIGCQVCEYEVRDGANLVQDIQTAGIKVAMIATPASVAQQVADQLVQAGVKAIVNYAPISLNTPADVHVQYIDPAIHLQRMTYYLD